MAQNKASLGILIPTVFGREEALNTLIWSIRKFCGAAREIIIITDNIEYHAIEFLFIPVSLLIAKDGKECPIGLKRERLYQKCTSTYAWQIDDDDTIAPNAIPLILEAMTTEPDCITFEEACTINGVAKRSNFSLKYTDWGDNEDGYDYVRTPFFKTPINTTICQQVPVPPLRFGEDHAWARSIRPLLQSEVHIDQPLYFYNHISSAFAERYGFDKDGIDSQKK